MRFVAKNSLPLNWISERPWHCSRLRTCPSTDASWTIQDKHQGSGTTGHFIYQLRVEKVDANGTRQRFTTTRQGLEPAPVDHPVIINARPTFQERSNRNGQQHERLARTEGRQQRAGRRRQRRPEPGQPEPEPEHDFLEPHRGAHAGQLRADERLAARASSGSATAQAGGLFGTPTIGANGNSLSITDNHVDRQQQRRVDLHVARSTTTATWCRRSDLPPGTVDNPVIINK
jgi:hypothetical protein